MSKIYRYGTNQPYDIVNNITEGLLEIRDDPKGQFCNIVYFGVKLSEKDMYDNDFAYLGEVERL